MARARPGSGRAGRDRRSTCDRRCRTRYRRRRVPARSRARRAVGGRGAGRRRGRGGLRRRKGSAGRAAGAGRTTEMERRGRGRGRRRGRGRGRGRGSGGAAGKVQRERQHRYDAPAFTGGMSASSAHARSDSDRAFSSAVASDWLISSASWRACTRRCSPSVSAWRSEATARSSSATCLRAAVCLGAQPGDFALRVGARPRAFAALRPLLRARGLALARRPRAASCRARAASSRLAPNWDRRRRRRRPTAACRLRPPVGVGVQRGRPAPLPSVPPRRPSSRSPARRHPAAGAPRLDAGARLVVGHSGAQGVDDPFEHRGARPQLGRRQDPLGRRAQRAQQVAVLAQQPRVVRPGVAVVTRAARRRAHRGAHLAQPFQQRALGARQLVHHPDRHARFRELGDRLRFVATPQALERRRQTLALLDERRQRDGQQAGDLVRRVGSRGRFVGHFPILMPLLVT